MTHSLSDFRQHDCERKEPTSNNIPAVRSVPDKPASRSFVTFTVYDDNNNKDMEVKIKQFDREGPLEDLLLWWLSVLKYIALKPANSPDLKFALIPKCLSEGGTIQSDWMTAKAEATALKKVTARGVETEIGESGEGFEQTVLRFFKTYLPEGTGEDQLATLHAVLPAQAWQAPSP